MECCLRCHQLALTYRSENVMSQSISLLNESDSNKVWKNRRLTTIIIAISFCLGTFYVFVWLLPSLFVPEATTLHPISPLQPLDRGFAVLDPENVRSMGLTENPHPLKDKEMERLIMIGDIHGNYRQLKKLLKKVEYRRGKDQILALGDFITKGPDSIRVLELLIEIEADCVLGNHEFAVLTNYAKFRLLEMPNFGDNKILGQTALVGPLRDPEFRLAKKLEPRHIHFINKCPVIQLLGPVPHYKRSIQNPAKGAFSEASVTGVAVHAGLEWNKSLKGQNPLKNIAMRAYIGPDYLDTTSDKNELNAVPWSKVFNNKQKLRKLKDAILVYYGHDASRGLNLKQFTKGLDSACVKGGKLLAMVLWKQKGKSMGEIRHYEQLVSVDC